MKKLFIVLFIMCISTQAFALDLNIYAGQYFGEKNTGILGSENPKYVQGTQVSETFLENYLRVYLGYETQMTGQNSDFSFHPDRIAYTVGFDINAYKGFGINLEHLCDHAVSGSGETRQFSLISLFYKTSYKPFD